MAHVEIYASPFCGFCHRARKLLQAKGVDFTEIDLAEHPERRTEMVERAGGRTTVPQIFIDGVHVGGSDELGDLEARGNLDPLLGRAGAPREASPR